VLRPQSPCSESNGRKQETEEQNKNQQMAKENTEETNQNQRSGQERMNSKESISRNDTKISKALEVRA